MAFGRTDERDIPRHPPAIKAAERVWDSFVQPIWASGHPAAYTGRTHDRNRTVAENCMPALAPKGPSTHGWPEQARPRGVYSTTAIISISTIAPGWASPLIWIVVLVGLATPK